MADGSIGGAEPRKTEPAAATSPPAVAQRGPEAAEPGAAAASVQAAAKADKGKAKEPLRELIDKLGRTQEMVARVDPALAATIRGIADTVNMPGRIEEPMFRTKVAYALQDAEKLVGPVINLPQGVREEMTRLASTSPGLQNERMQELMRSTATMDDRGLVRVLRKDAAEIARASDQASPDMQSKVEVLENRVRLSGQPEIAPQTVAKSSDVTNMKDAAAGGAVQQSVQGEAAAKVIGHASELSSRQGLNTAAQQQAMTDQTQQQRGMGATFAIMSALRKPEPTSPAPWDQQLTPLKGRIAQFIEKAQANEEEAGLRAAERSGQAAVQALRAFANGPGASIMGKIQAAGKTDPDGPAGVAAGMREGGPYADLRHTFNAGLLREKGLASALDHVSAAVS